MTGQLSKVSGNWLLAATILGSSLVFIDGSVVSIALPVIQTSFHSTVADAQWVVEAYTLVLGALMLLCGALGDRFGRKRLFVGGVGVFAAGSVLCGLAPSMPALIAARVLQGAGGTMMAPASLALIGANFQGQARGRAIGAWSGLTAVASAVGPAAGGAIVDHLGWRWAFFINVPIAIAVFAIAIRHVRESRDESESGPIDVWGSVLVTAGLAGIVYAFVTGGAGGWNTRAIATLVAGIAALGGFVALESVAANPLLPLRLFANRVFSGINAMTFLLYAALSGIFFFVPFVMIQVDGYSATVTGLAMLPFVVLLVALSRYSGALIYRVGARPLLVGGPAIAALGFAALGLLPHLDYWSGIFPSYVLIGIGMGFTVAPLTATMIESVPERHVGLASGINNAMSRVAGLLAVAILGALVSAAFAARLETHVRQAALSPSQRSDVVAQRAAMAGAHLRDSKETAVVRAAYLDGFRVAALACALMAAASAAVAAATMGGSSAKRR
jgi:EmrB/QacA subfamily drug resistance transporter